MKDKYINLSVLSISIILCLLILEIFIRMNPHLHSEGYQASSNDRVVYELNPNFIIKSLGSKVSSQGLYDRYFSKEKPIGTYRIAVVGDSTSFGLHVGPEQSFPKVFEKLLNKRLGKNFEVMNFSVPGYNTSQEYEVIKEKVINFDPNMVILVFDKNDTHLCNYFKPKVEVLNFLYLKSYAFHFVLRQLDLLLNSYTKPVLVRKGDQSFYSSDMKYKHLLPMWVSFKKNVLSMFYPNQKICKYPGLEESAYIDGDPPSSKEQVPKKYWHMLGLKNYKIHMSKINTLLKSKNIEFILSGFFEDSPEELKISKEAGSNIICDFDKFLKEDGLVFDNVEHRLGHLSVKGHYLCAEYLYKVFTNRINVTDMKIKKKPL